MKQNKKTYQIKKGRKGSPLYRLYVKENMKRVLKNKIFDNIVFRLFVGDKPVGFPCWNGYYGENLFYTTGEPEKRDGWKGRGWNETKIVHNRKEILEINYV